MTVFLRVGGGGGWHTEGTTAVRPSREAEGVGRPHALCDPKHCSRPCPYRWCPPRKFPSFKGPEVLRGLCFMSRISSPLVDEVSAIFKSWFHSPNEKSKP